MLLFPFAEFWWAYVGFTSFVLLLLALDLGVFHRRPRVVSFRESLGWSIVWVALALTFNYAFYLYVTSVVGPVEGRQAALEFLTGYLVEKSLAVDNVFVFVLVFNYFGVPPIYQHRVLFYGVLGALVFRAAFIAVGAVLMQYHLVVMLFGVFLLLTGIKLLWSPEQKIEPERNPLIRLFRRVVPMTTDVRGPQFLVKTGGRWHATPLLVALLFMEMSDIIFAADSVPAIFALSREPLIVYMSNVFAVLGLRAMYFLLADAIRRFDLLKYALALILIFVGLKMTWLNDLFGGKFPIEWSLGIIAALLAGAVVASLVKGARQECDDAREQRTSQHRRAS
ncbi:MAG TPA: TerC family protein [Vicinamibacterales bacterium]|nr:TerC family protein [Vicinamibacterales bacterium]